MALGVFSQEIKSMGIGYSPGFLLAHRADLKAMAAHNAGYEFFLERTAHQSEWGKFYKKPSVGVNFLFYDLGREHTGYAFGLNSYAKFQLLDFGSTHLSFKMGAGLGYLTKKFDPYTNRRNIAIGSHLNGAMQFAFLAKSSIKNCFVEYGIGISHYSNAAFTMPNLGFNIPSLSVRFGYNTKPADVEYKPELKIKRWQPIISVFYGKKERDYAKPTVFHNYGIQARMIYSNKKPTGAWRIGIDAAQDKTYRFANDPGVDLASLRMLEKLEVDVAGGYEWRMGRLKCFGEIGAYVYKPDVLKNPLLQRMGLMYDISQKVQIQGALRFHRGVADYFEWGVGFKL